VTDDQLRRPPFSVESCVSRDAWTHGAALTRWRHEYAQVRPGAFSGFLNVAWLGPLQLAYERLDQPILYRGVAWPDSRIFLSLLPGSDTVHYEQRPVAAAGLTMHRWDAVEQSSCGDRAELVVVALDEHFLAHHFSQIPGLEALLRPAPVRCAPDPVRAESFRNSVRGVLSDINERPDLLGNPTVCAGFQQRVLDSIVDVFTATATDHIRWPAPSRRAYIVGRALDYIDARLSDPLSIVEICTMIRVCPRSLSNAFANVLGTSPKSYVLTARLMKVHREISDRRECSSIESVAMRWGFAHMGRFARYYREAFGQYPSETLRKKTRHKHAPIVERSPRS